MLNLGSLEFTLGINTQALDSAYKAIQDFGTKVSQVQNMANRGADTQVASYRRIENAILSAGETLNSFLNKIENAKITPDIQAGMIQQAETAYAALVNQATNFKKVNDATNLDRSMAAYRNTLNEANRELQQLVVAEREMVQQAAAADNAWAASLRQVNAQLDAGWQRINRQQESMLNSAAAARQLADAQLQAAKALEAETANAARFDQFLGSIGVKWGQTAEATKSAAASMDVFIQKENEVKAIMNQVTAAVNKTVQATNQQAAAADRALIAQQRALAGLSERTLNLGTKIQVADFGSKYRAQLEQLSAQIQEVMNRIKTQQLTVEPLNPKAFAEASIAYRQELGQISRSFAVLRTEAMAPTMENFNTFRNRVGQLGTAMLLLNGHLGGMSTRFIALSTLARDMSGTMVALIGGITALGVGVVALAKESFDATIAIQKINQGFIATLGTAAAANTQMQYLVKTADNAGLSFKGLATEYTSFLAASVNAGQTVAQTQNEFSVLAKAAGILHLSVEQTDFMLRAFQQMLSKGTVQSEELRRQLANNLPGAFAIAAKAMGVTTTKLEDMIRKHQILSTEFLPKFVEQLKKAYNIDTKPIETLQADLNRAGNATTLFFAAFANNIHFASVAMTILEKFSSVLKFLTDNMAEVMKIVEGAIGAILGFAAAWGAWVAVAVASGAIDSFLTSMTAIIVATREAIVATDLLTASEVALNLVLEAAPWGKIIGLVARLGIAIGVAVLGYREMQKWLDNDDAAMQTQIKTAADYIDRQKQLGFQVAATTQELIKQQIALVATARSAAAVDTQKLLSMRNDSTVVLPGGLLTIKGHTDKDLQDQIAKVKGDTGTLQDLAKNLRGLMQVSKLPELGASNSLADGTGTGKTKQIRDRTEAVKDLILAYQELQDKLRVLDQGPDAFDKLDALRKAKDVLDSLDAKGLTKVDQELRAAGFSSGTLQERLAAMYLTVDKGKKSLDEFVKVWHDIDNTIDSIESNRLHIADIFNNPNDKMSGTFIDNLQKAQEAIKDMQPSAVQALRNRLAELGYAVSGTSDSTDELVHALAALWNEEAIGKETTSALANVFQSIQQNTDAVTESLLQAQGLQAGLRDLYGENKLSNFVKEKTLVDQLARSLKEGGTDANTAAIMVDAFSRSLKAADAAATLQAWAQQAADFKDGIAQAFATAASSIVTSFGNIRKAAQQLFTDLANLFAKQFIEKPIFDSLTKMMAKINIPGLSPKKSAVDALQQTIAANDNGVTKLNFSALTAAMQVQALGNAAQVASIQMGAPANDFNTVFADFSSTVDTSSEALAKQTTAVNAFGSSLPAVIQSLLGATTHGGTGVLGTLLSVAGMVAGGIHGGGINFGASANLTNMPHLGGGNLFAGYKFAMGGITSFGRIHGPGTSTSDSIPIMASDGEFIFNAGAVRRWGVSLLEAMNSGRITHFAEGGLVSSGGSDSGLGTPSLGRRQRPMVYAPVFPNVTSAREAEATEAQAARHLRRQLGKSIRR